MNDGWKVYHAGASALMFLSSLKFEGILYKNVKINKTYKNNWKNIKNFIAGLHSSSRVQVKTGLEV